MASAEGRQVSLLPTGSAAAADFCNKVHEVIYDLLMLKVRPLAKPLS